MLGQIGQCHGYFYLYILRNEVHLRFKHILQKRGPEKGLYVTHPILQMVSSYHADDHLICITDKRSCASLSTILTESEYLFFQNSLDKKVKQILFPRGEGSVIVKVFPQKGTEAEQQEAIRLAGNDVQQLCNQYKLRKVKVMSFAKKPCLIPFLEGMLLGSYSFVKYFTKEDKRQARLEHLYVVDTSGDVTLAAELTELQHLTEAVYSARTLVNEPLSYLDTLKMTDEVRAIAEKSGFTVETLGKEQLQAMRMGGILAVNQASSVPPQFHILEWKPADAKNEKPLILVGKGVVYDTGGLSLKPAEGMDYMKCDMAGAGTVISTISAVSKNKLPVHIIGLIPSTDNLVSDKAMAPGDVIRMYSGTTVEVVNTDAEGRLILADALHYASKLSPDLVIDFATLTGAAVRALGSHAICYMGTASKKIKHDLEDSGWATYERLVELPLWAEYGDELKSNIADLKNLGSSYAGMITAGKFLEHFTTYPWLHLDIAGPAYLKSAQGYRTKDGTGVGVRLMYHFIKTHYCA